MRKPAEPQPVRETEVVEVIKIKALTGRGSRNDVVREVDQYFTPQGDYLFKKDAWAEEELRLRIKRLEEIRRRAEQLRIQWLKIKRPIREGAFIPESLALRVETLIQELDKAVKEEVDNG